MEALRVGLVGYGGAGRGIHARLLREAGQQVSAVVTRSLCFVAVTRFSSSLSTLSASASLMVTSTLAAIGSCSAWLIRSVATCTGSALSSARIAISVGPASASMPTSPRSNRFAAVTHTLPGPVIMSTGSHSPGMP